MSKGFGERLRDLLWGYQESLLRAQRELEELRVLARRREAEAAERATERVVVALLPVLDALDAALAQGPEDPEALLEGVRMTREMAARALEDLGLRRIEPREGQSFDPRLHEAVEVVEGSGGIARTLRPGYLLGERLIRPARVVVTKPKEVRENG